MRGNYESPFSARYASQYMTSLFSAETRIETWRRLWVELARAESELGLPITKEQVADLEAHISDIDFEYAAEKEKEFRHDVMAHIHAWMIGEMTLRITRYIPPRMSAAAQTSPIEPPPQVPINKSK